MPIVTIDGRPVTVSDEEAAQLSQVGKSTESIGATAGRLQEAGTEDYYSSAGQEVKAGAEGLLSGMSVGMSDLLLDSEDLRKRARYNPGVRLGTELVGAIAPLVLSGGESGLASAASLTPTALAARVGVAGSRALRVGEVGALAIEGGIQGAGMAASAASLANDPITAETLLAGAGWGAALSAGMGIVSKGVTHAGQAAENRVLTKRAEAAEAAIRRTSPAMDNAAVEARELAKTANRAVKEVDKALSSTNLKALVREYSSAGDEVRMWAASSGQPLSHFKQLLHAAQEGAQVGGEAGVAAVNAYREAVASSAEKFGVQIAMPPMPAVKQVVNLAESVDTLRRIPSSPSKLAAMTDERAAEFFPNLKKALTSSGDELDGAREAVLKSLGESLGEVGLAAKGASAEDIVDSLAGYRAHLREAAKSVRQVSDSPKTASYLDFIRRAGGAGAGRAASGAARSAGLGAFAGGVAYTSGAGALRWLVAEMTGLRAAAHEHLDKIIGAISPTISRAAKEVAPVTDHLRRSIMDAPDKDQRRPLREAAAERIREINNIAGSAPDAAYSVAEPLLGTSPEMATAVAAQLMKGLQHLGAVAPKDPGGANNLLNSDWQPSMGQTMALAASLEAVKAPFDALSRIFSGEGDPAASEALWSVYPGIMQEAAARVVERLPELQDKTDFATRASLSVALRVPLDGLLVGRNVEALQRALTSPPPPSSAAQMSRPENKGGRPGANQSMPTPSQTRAQSLASS